MSEVKLDLDFSEISRKLKEFRFLQLPANL